MRKVLFFCLLLISFIGYGQSRKTIKNNNIKSIVTWKYNKTGKKMKESAETFDKNGNLVDEIKYDSATGKQKSHTSYKYNTSNDKTEVIEYDTSGKIKKKTKYIYQNDLKIGKDVYDGNNNLKYKKVYEIIQHD